MSRWSIAFAVPHFAALVSAGILLGCDIMRGDQIVFIVDDSGVDAAVDNEEVEVQTHRLGLQFSKIEMTKLSAHVGIMSELNKDSSYTVTARLMIPTPFTVEPDRIIMSLESQTRERKLIPHVLEVAENSPWRQGASTNEQEVWRADFHVVPDLKASECDRLRLRIQIELDGPNDTHHNVDVFLKLKREKITIPNPIVLRFSGKYGSRSLATGDFNLIQTGTASNEIGGTSMQYLQQA